MLLLFVGSAAAQVPAKLGTETKVNTFPSGIQERPAVDGLKTGGYVVAWHSLNQDGSGNGVYLQRFSVQGAKVGNETRANTATAGDQSRAAIAGLTNGNFVVAWQSRSSSSSPSDIYVRRFNAAGVQQGAPNRVSAQSPGFPFNIDASVAKLPNGGFVVVWASCPTSFCVEGRIVGQRFDGNGAKSGKIFRIDTFGAASNPRVAALTNGIFMAVWQSNNQDQVPGFGIYGQRFSAAGQKAGQEFKINTYVTSSQVTPAIAVLKAGTYVIAWDSFGQDGSGNGIYMQRYTAQGAKLGNETRVNPTTVGPQVQPAVTAVSDGGYVVAWCSDDGSFNGIFGRRYTLNGAGSGGVFRINTATSGIQDEPALATYAGGRFVATWTTEVSLDVSSQRYLLP